MAYLITFDGLNGGGKTTVIKKLKEKFKDNNISNTVLTYKCPGDGIPEVRDIFKNPEKKFHGLTDLFLIAADVHELFDKKIVPLMCTDSIILVDRLIDSTFVYQSVLGGLSEEVISVVTYLTTKNIRPNLTFILDLSYEESIKRRKKENWNDRFEQTFESSFADLRLAYLNLVNKDPSRIKVVDAEKNIDGLVEECYNKIINVMKG